MTTRLKIYGSALRHLGERSTTLTEDRKSRRNLDEIWDDGFVDFVLEQGYWNFAMRSAQADYSTDIAPDFGYRRAFDKPTDWIRTAAVSLNEYFNDPLLAYADEAGYWYSDFDTIYVRWVSNHTSYGGDLSKWPQTFVRYAGAQLAVDACEVVTGSDSKLEALQKTAKRYLADARSKDGMNEGTQFLPAGSWVRSRGGRRTGRMIPNLV